MTELTIAVALAALILGGAAGVFWGIRSSQQQREKAEQAWQEERLQLRSALESGQRALHDLELEKARLQQENARLPELQQKLEEQERQARVLNQQLLEKGEALAGSQERLQAMAVLEQRLQETEERTDSLRDRLAEQEGENRRLRALMEQERKHVEEQRALLESNKQRLQEEFQNLANRIFDEKSSRFTDQNRTTLSDALKPFREQLSDFRKKVDEIHLSDTRERASLRQEILHLRELNQQINQEAMNLTRALKGDKKAQGNWGEMILERVLEESGLRRGHEYETQGSFRDAEGNLLRPDVIIHLPENKDVVVDSKVSLLAYERFSAAEDDLGREQALNEHVRAVREHIRALSGKDYSALKGLRSLDFVLMFMPIESAFMAAFQHDEKLFSEAFERRIVVVTPTTLLATLRTIENIWRYERQNENAQLIAAKAGTIYDKLRGFLEDMEKLGNQLGTVHKTYDAAMNKLTQGRGNLVRQAEGFIELGVKVKKPLPRAVTEMAGLEEEGPETS